MNSAIVCVKLVLESDRSQPHCNRTQIPYGLYYAYQIIERRNWQYPELQRMAGVKQDAPRRRGAELSSRICRWSTSSGRRLNMLQLTVQNGAKLLPDVPKGTGGTKSKSKVSAITETYLAENRWNEMIKTGVWFANALKRS